MALNRTLLTETMAQIDAHPEDWEQSTWRCGSGMCFAGWAATLNDREWVDTPDGQYSTHVVVPPGFPYSGPAPRPLINEGKAVEGEYTVSVSTAAQYDLGLTSSQADAMFSGSNSRETLHKMVDALLENETADLYRLDGSVEDDDEDDDEDED